MTFLIIIGGVLVALGLLAFMATGRNPRGRSPWARGLVDLNGDPNKAERGRRTETTGHDH